MGVAAAGLSVFIPVYNEAELLPANLARLKAYLEGLGRPFEVLVGSNGSTDATPWLGRELAAAEPWLTFFHLPAKGPGRAFREAVLRARHDLILTQDMDLSVDLDFLRLAAGLLEEGDVVVGSKQMGRQRRSGFRVAASAVFILAARALLGLKYRDYSLAAKGFRRAWLRGRLGWVDPGTAYVLNLIYLAQREGRRVVEVPVVCHDDRESRFNLVHEGLSRFGRLIQLWWRARLKLAGPWEGA